MHKKAAMLEDRGVVSVSGADAAGFLQGLLTNDVERLEPGRSALRGAAHAAGQDPVRHDRRARARRRSRPISSTARRRRRPNSPGGSAFYKLRAKVAIADVSADRAVAAFWGDEPPSVAEGLLYADPRDPRLGWRAILPRPIAAAVGSEHVGEYEGLRIAVAAPKGGLDFAYGDAFPHDANLDLLHGVDFDKGCYVGQEVVSRMKHRGTRAASASRASSWPARRRRRARPSWTASSRSACSGRPRDAKRWRCCGSTAPRRRRRRGGRSAPAASAWRSPSEGSTRSPGVFDRLPGSRGLVRAGKRH